jgi:predicted DNA-binding transcriptional regulator AlpA
MREAAAMLGVSHAKMWQLVKDGVLLAETNPLDRREKLIRLADVEHLRARRPRGARPWPRTIGAADLGVQSDEVEDWLEAHWRPC